MATLSQYLHFDSAAATYTTDTTNTTGNSTNPYKAFFPMNQSFRKIKRVYLKSCEIPVGFSNIRTGSTNSLLFKINGTTYGVSLNEKYYQTMDALITDINTACAGGFGGSVPSFSITSSTTTPYRLAVTFSGTTVTTFQFQDTNLSKYILGFRSTDPLAANTVNSSCNYNLSADSYILMYMPNLNSMNASMSGQTSTFKIPLLGFTNSVFYYFDMASFVQYVDITDQNLVLSGLQVVLFDKFGKNIQPNGLDWSMTLQIEYYV